MDQEVLRRIPLLADLSTEDMAQLSGRAERIATRAGQVIVREGDVADAMYLVLGGVYEVTKRRGEREVALGVCRAGQVLGEISLFERSQHTANIRTVEDGELLRISQPAFAAVLAASPSTSLAVAQAAMKRLHQVEDMLMQNQKLAGLGTLAAGLAHDMNNPAAAVSRSSPQLREAVERWLQTDIALGCDGSGGLPASWREDLRWQLRQNAVDTAVLDTLERGDRENDLQRYLQDHGLEEPWEAAAQFVQGGWSLQSLEALLAGVSPALGPRVLRWLAAGALVNTLLNEVATGASRLSEIVNAVKSYTHLDQAPVQQVDLHRGLQDTLLVLHHKLGRQIEVRLEFDPALPRIQGYASDLNQAWTNLIDNAIDAMEGHGTLLLRTTTGNGEVMVDICDTGSGIPTDIQQFIFEPFFTTKPQGAASGLGLHLVYNIVIIKHGGSIRVDSRPGHTCFHIVLPLHLPNEADG